MNEGGIGSFDVLNSGETTMATLNNILARLRVESHFESDPNIAESGPNIVDVESSFASRVNLFLYQS